MIEVVDRGTVVGEYDTFKAAIGDLTDGYASREIVDRFWLVQYEDGASRRWLPGLYRREIGGRVAAGVEWVVTEWRNET
jgi:hypothetical protein